MSAYLELVVHSRGSGSHRHCEASRGGNLRPDVHSLHGGCEAGGGLRRQKHTRRTPKRDVRIQLQRKVRSRPIEHTVADGRSAPRPTSAAGAAHLSAHACGSTRARPWWQGIQHTSMLQGQIVCTKKQGQLVCTCISFGIRYVCVSTAEPKISHMRALRSVDDVH